MKIQLIIFIKLLEGLPKTPEEDETVNKEEDGEDDEILRFPPPFRVPDDPDGRNFGFENDGPEDDSPSHADESPNPEGDSPSEKGDIPGDDSSGFREELEDRSDYEAKAESMDSGVIEQELEQEDVQLAENVPDGRNDFIVPPLYSSTKKERKESGQDDDFFADMLGEARGGSEDSEGFRQNYGFENEGRSTENEENAGSRMGDYILGKTERDDNSSYDDVFEETESRRTLKEEQSNFREDFGNAVDSLQKVEKVTDYQNVNDSFLSRRSEFRYEENEDLELKEAIAKYPNLPVPNADDIGPGALYEENEVNEDLGLQEAIAKYPNLPVPNAVDIGPRVLPTPGIRYVEDTINGRDDSMYLETNSFSKEIRRSSQSITKLNEVESSMNVTQPLSLPSPGLRRVNLVRQVELTLPRSTYEALQTKENEEFSEIDEKPIRRKSIPVIVDGPFGTQMKEIRLNDDGVISSSKLKTNRESRSSVSFGSVSFEDIPLDVDLQQNSSIQGRSQNASNLNEFEPLREGNKQMVNMCLDYVFIFGCLTNN